MASAVLSIARMILSRKDASKERRIVVMTVVFSTDYIDEINRLKIVYEQAQYGLITEAAGAFLALVFSRCLSLISTFSFGTFFMDLICFVDAFALFLTASP